MSRPKIADEWSKQKGAGVLQGSSAYSAGGTLLKGVRVTSGPGAGIISGPRELAVRIGFGVYHHYI